MQTEGDAAQQLVNMAVHESLDIAEHALRLAGLTAKQLAALVLALLKDNQKLKGKTNMNRLLRADKPITTFAITKERQAEFESNLKSHGILFSTVRHAGDTSGLVDVVVWQDRAPQVNNILETMGYTQPEKGKPEKNGPARARPGDKSKGRGFGLLQQTVERMTNSMSKPLDGKSLESLPKEMLMQFVAILAGENMQHKDAQPLAHLFDGKPVEKHIVDSKVAATVQDKADVLKTPVFFAPSEKEGKSVMLAKSEDAAVINKLFQNEGHAAPMKGVQDQPPQVKTAAKPPKEVQQPGTPEPKRRGRPPKNEQPAKGVRADIQNIKAQQGKAAPKAPKAPKTKSAAR